MTVFLVRRAAFAAFSLAVVGIGCGVAAREEKPEATPVSSAKDKTAAPVRLAQNTPKVERQVAPAWTGRPDEFEYPNREKKLKLPLVMNELGLKEGSVVADIGAGGGWLSVRLAKRVGPSGTVYAQEILPKFTAYIAERAKREKLPQIKTVLGTPLDPKLPANSLDAVVILNAYHEFTQPYVMLEKLQHSMKRGGRIGILERDTDGLRLEAEQAYRATGKIKRRVTEKPDKDPRTDDHRLALPVVRRELEKAGFEYLGSAELEEDNYLAVGRKK